jgi:uncharacterized protein
MAANVVADAAFLVALIRIRDRDHDWAIAQARRFPPPWKTCDAALSESFHLLGPDTGPSLMGLLRRGAVISAFRFDDGAEEVLRLMEKYVDVPMSFADACLVRMTETLSDPILLTTDSDFRIYRRHGRHAVPCVSPAG